MTKKEGLARMIRIFSVPPVMILILLLILGVKKTGVFRSPEDFTLSYVCLGLIPVIAYPLQMLLPKEKEKGREGQRRFAFIFSIIGYSFALLCGIITKVNGKLLMIYLTYFLSVLFLTVLNRGLHIRASGHACSVTGPLLFLIYYLNAGYLIPCTAVYLLIAWASLTLERHRPSDIFFGTLSCVLSFLISMLVIQI